MGPQGTHTGIHKRNAGATVAPGCQSFGVRLANAPHEGMEIAEFDRRLILQLLNEMTVPVQP